MAEHYRTLSAVLPVITRLVDGRREVLLLRRRNTGFGDGHWDFAGGGHVDEGETAKQAVVRECREELGIEVAVEDVAFGHLFHDVASPGGKTYYDLYFQVRSFAGEPRIAEPEKCDGLQWFDLAQLPEALLEVRRSAFALYLAGIPYSERLG